MKTANDLRAILERHKKRLEKDFHIKKLGVAVDRLASDLLRQQLTHAA